MTMRCAPVLGIALLCSGCSSSYKPAVSPRLAIVQTSSGLAFVRGGKQYEHGFFGGELRDAVAGVPAAEEHADAHSGLMIGGFLFSVGAVGLTTAAFYTSASSDPENPGDTTAGFLLLGALGSALVSSFMYMGSAPHLWDAVNIYNDEVQRAAVEKWRRERARPPAQ